MVAVEDSTAVAVVDSTVVVEAMAAVAIGNYTSAHN